MPAETDFRPGLEIVKAPCDTCGGFRNHVVRVSLTTDEERIPGIQFQARTDYQIIQCQGCDEVRFRTTDWNSDDRDQAGPVCTAHVYPETTPKARSASKELVSLPYVVANMYREALEAFNSGAKILAGAGLRAIVEALCKDRKIDGDNLQDKIDALVDRELLAKPQADLLHEERFLGNSALHELEAPADEDLTLGFEIIEALLITIYVLPDKARQLRRNRHNAPDVPALGSSEAAASPKPRNRNR